MIKKIVIGFAVCLLLIILGYSLSVETLKIHKVHGLRIKKLEKNYQALEQRADEIEDMLVLDDTLYFIDDSCSKWKPFPYVRFHFVFDTSDSTRQIISDSVQIKE